MEVILLERVAKLGQMGEVVRVKDGFARNFLLKRGKALRATADNRAKYDGMKAELEAHNLQGQGRGHQGRREDRRPRYRRSSARPPKPASCSVRSRCATSSRRWRADGVTVGRTPGLARCADQGDRPAEGDDRRAPRGRDQHHGDGRAQRRRSRAHQARRGHLDPSGRPGRRRRSARRRRRVLRSGSPARGIAEPKPEAPPRSKVSPARSNAFKPGLISGRACRFLAGYACSLSIAIDASAVAVCFSTPSITQNTSAATTATWRPGLDHPRAADQALAGRRRQQVQLVFRRQRRLAARGRRRDRGRIVDQERGDAAVEEAVLLQQLRPAIDRKRAGAARQFRKFRADQVHEPLPADTVADPVWRSARNPDRDRRSRRSPFLDRRRPAHGSRRRSAYRPAAADRRGRGPTERRGRKSAQVRRSG